MPAVRRPWLSKDDLQNLYDSGLTDETIRANGLYSIVTDPEKVAKLLNCDSGKQICLGGLVIPYPDIDGNVNGFVRVRPHAPRTIKGKVVKYESPKGSSARAYFPVGSLPGIREVGHAIFLTEGEKKSLSLSQLDDVAAIGIGGVWCGCKKGTEELIDDLAKIDWSGRVVYVVFDFDEKQKTRQDVQSAAVRLAKALKNAGATEVYNVQLPPGPNGEKQGVDDYLVTNGEEAFRELVEQARLANCLNCLTAFDQDDQIEPTAFPLDVFPRPLREFVEENSKCMPCPPDYIGLGVLAVVSSFIGPNRPLEVKPGWQERAAMYAVTVGPTGSRKTPSLEKALAPARKRDQQLAAEYKVAKHEHEQRRREAKANKTDFSDAPPIAQQHVTTDTTIEALADVLTWNPRGLLVHRDEATGWVASLNQYKSGHGADRQFWLSAWSCQDYTINRKGKEPQRISQPFLSVIGNIPPDMLGELKDRRGREDGFIDRILFAYPDPVQVKWTDESPDAELETKYVDVCLKIGQLPAAKLTLAKAALAEFASWYDEHNRSHDGPAGSWAKMDGYCVRLANILHHLRYAYGETMSPNEVDVISMRRAILLIEYFKNHARRALGRTDTGQERKAFNRLLAFVRNAPELQVRPRGLIAAQIASNADEAKDMLERLVSLDLGEFVEGRRKDQVIFQARKDFEDVIRQFEKQ